MGGGWGGGGVEDCDDRPVNPLPERGKKKRSVWRREAVKPYVDQYICFLSPSVITAFPVTRSLGTSVIVSPGGDLVPDVLR